MVKQLKLIFVLPNNYPLKVMKHVDNNTLRPLKQFNNSLEYCTPLKIISCICKII